MTNEHLVELARAAQNICAKYNPLFNCDVFDAMESELRLLYPDNPPMDGQVVVTISPASESIFAPVELVKDLEAMPGVWKVYQGEHPIHGLS